MPINEFPFFFSVSFDQSYLALYEVEVPDIQTELAFHLASFIQPDIVLLYNFLLTDI